MKPIVLNAWVSIAAAGLALPSLAGSAAREGPPEVAVAAVAMAGSGCPATNAAAGSAPGAASTGTATIAGDGSLLPINMPPFTAATDSATRKALARVNCEAVVTLAHTAGWQVQAVAVRLSVSGNVANGSADVSAEEHEQGQGATARGAATWAAGQPISAAGKIELTIDLKAGEWSKCGDRTTLVVGVAAKVRGDGRLSVDNGAGVELQWRTCDSKR